MPRGSWNLGFTGGLGAVLLSLAAARTAAAPPTAAPVSIRIADAVLARWPDPLTLSPKGWEYTSGIVLRGIAEVWKVHHEPRHLAYIKRWVDAFVAADGRIDLGDDASGHNLDRIQPGVLLLLLDQETGERRYQLASMWLRARFDEFPRNLAGGYWHKKKYPNEMWLDGLYMAQPFLTSYGRRFGEGSFCWDTAVRQILLAASHTRVDGQHLFRHAWDEDRNAAWADPRTGVSPEVWGRASGWFLMALVDVLEDLPPSHPGYGRLVALLREAASGVRETQDPKSGLWHQVMDKGGLADNWLETSASGMFVYALRRGVERGHLDPSFGPVAEKGWAGLLAGLGSDAAGRPVIRGAVEGMSVQKDYAGYVARRRLEDSPHGICAYLLAASAMESPPRPLR